MRIQALYFGILKEILGRDSEILDAEADIRIEDVIRLLRGRASNREDQVWQSLAVALNHEYADRSAILHDGDEVALLPPVSGGSAARSA